MRIYLIGLPSTGKTVVGKELAEQLHYEFIDLNIEIEKNALMFLDELESRVGEIAIRKAEEDLLKSYLEKDNIVVATNSYVINNRKNKKLLDGLVIYLDTEPKIIEQRLVNKVRSYDIINTSLEDLHSRHFLQYLNFSNLQIANNGDLEDTISNIISNIK